MWGRGVGVSVDLVVNKYVCVILSSRAFREMEECVGLRVCQVKGYDLLSILFHLSFLHHRIIQEFFKNEQCQKKYFNLNLLFVIPLGGAGYTWFTWTCWKTRTSCKFDI